MTDPMTAGEWLEHMGDDAQKWARGFIEHAKSPNFDPLDEGLLIAWFANAIEYSTAIRRAHICQSYLAEMLAAAGVDEDAMVEAMINALKTTTIHPTRYSYRDQVRAVLAAIKPELARLAAGNARMREAQDAALEEAATIAEGKMCAACRACDRTDDAIRALKSKPAAPDAAS